MTTPSSWDDAYTGGQLAPWDIGRPQAAFARLADEGLLAGQVLDVGCGTGEHALLAAAHGADATGVDVSPRAIEQARGKAAARGIPAAAGGQIGPAAAGGQIGTARFEVADALSLGDLGLSFDTVIVSDRPLPAWGR